MKTYLIFLLLIVSLLPSHASANNSQLFSYTYSIFGNWDTGPCPPYGESYQRYMIEHEGRIWYWYHNMSSNEIGYSSTTNGITFTSFVPIGQTLLWRISVDKDEYGNIHLSWCNGTENSPIYYRCGKLNPNDGSISWNSSFQIAVPAEVNITYSRTNIQIDSQGYPWIGYQRWNGSYCEGMVTKSQWKNGTWKTETSFPKTVVATSTTSYRVLPKQLPNGKMLIFYASMGTKLYSRFWNGSGLEPSVEATPWTLMSGGTSVEFSAVSLNDTVYIGCLRDTPRGYYFFTYNATAKTYSAPLSVTSFPEDCCGIGLCYDLSKNVLYYWVGNYSSSPSIRSPVLYVFRNNTWILENKRIHEAYRYNGKIHVPEFTSNKNVAMVFTYNPDYGMASVRVDLHFITVTTVPTLTATITIDGNTYTTPTVVPVATATYTISLKSYAISGYIFNHWTKRASPEVNIYEQTFSMPVSNDVYLTIHYSPAGYVHPKPKPIPTPPPQQKHLPIILLLLLVGVLIYLFLKIMKISITISS